MRVGRLLAGVVVAVLLGWGAAANATTIGLSQFSSDGTPPSELAGNLSFDVVGNALTITIENLTNPAFDITAIFCFPPQWGWANGDGDGVEMHFRSAFFGFPDWVLGTVVFGNFREQSFILYNGDGGGTPVDETTWSGIKDLYN